MRYLLLPALLALALALAARSAGGADGATPRALRDAFQEPPERIAVTVGDERIVLETGELATLPDGTPVSAELLDTRVFDSDAPFTFEYPRGWRFSGAGGEAGAWWSLAGMGASASVRRQEGDPLVATREYVRTVQGGTARDVGPIARDLGGRIVTGLRCRARGFSMRGGPEGDWIVECYAVEDDADSTWIVALHRQLAVSASVPGIELVEVDGVFEPVLSPTVTPDPVAPTMDALAASWRWRR